MTPKRGNVRRYERKDPNEYGRSVNKARSEAISKFRILFYFNLFRSAKMTLEELVFAKIRQKDGHAIARMCTQKGILALFFT